MDKMTCIIVDDEPLARTIIADYVNRVGSCTIKGQFDSALKALEFLKKEKVDLIFLDIQMPVLDGLNFIKGMTQPPKVIFTTAHRQYAVEGFEINAVDYLVKPIPFHRFVQAINKVDQNRDENIDLSNASNAAFFKVDRKKIKVNFEDILIIESLKDYIKVILKDRSFVTYQTLTGILALLPDTMFVQVHRSFIVNYHLIDSIEGNVLKIDTHSIPLGRNHKESALSKIYSTGAKVWR